MSATAQTPPALFSPAWINDPYPTYRHHLGGATVQLIDETWRIWGVFRYAACTSLFRSPLLSSARPAAALVRTGEAELLEFRELVDHMHRWLLLRDPPSHTDLRKAMNRGFSPAIVERLRAGVELTVAQILNPMQPGQEIDVVRDIAYPLPVKVISHLLGIPESEHGRCIELTNDIAVWFGNFLRTPDSARIAQRAMLELVDLFKAVAAHRKGGGRQEDGEGALIDLLLEVAADARISQEELYAQCVMLLFGGHETTRHWIGNTVHTLLEHPEALQALREQPSLVRTAMEEVLRFESPVRGTSRGVTADLDCDGITVRKGETLLFFVSAAHRDADQFPDPDRFDIHREHIRHLAFGGDAHVCIGSTLARLEGQTVLRELLRRFPDFRRTQPGADWLPVVGFRGLRTLPIRL
jgi:cytochrome P450